jgi:hypothetical protein
MFVCFSIPIKESKEKKRREKQKLLFCYAKEIIWINKRLFFNT